MSKRFIGACFLAAVLFSSPVFAAQNVANPSQKGSLLMWPLVTIDPEYPENTSDTLIEISNDSFGPVHVECEYVNQKKARVNFDFDLTGKATLTWDVLSGASDTDFAAAQFPTATGPFPGDVFAGELVCIAVDSARANQIAFNHLTGSATVLDVNDADAEQIRQAFKYNAWAFAARCTACPGGLAADNTVQGTPGQLVLSGGGDGTYDACPLYNIVNFMPNGATLAPVTTLDNDLAVMSCNQDLRQDYVIHETKLQFTVWNEFENSFTGSYYCADSVSSVPLSSQDGLGLVNASNFDYSTLRTANARYQVQGVSSSQCPGSENAGLLGVATASTAIAPDTGEDQELGNTTSGAGTLAGFVLWDPAGPTPLHKRHH